jgi:hypothetical protein
VIHSSLRKPPPSRAGMGVNSDAVFNVFAVAKIGMTFGSED